MFDPSAPHIIILVIVLLLLFGSRRLPGAAKSLGQSMHIFKRSVSGLDTDEVNSSQQIGSPPALTSDSAANPRDATQTQLEELQRQVKDLQKQTAGDAAQTREPF